MAFFKKRVTPEQFGELLVKSAHANIAADAGRSLEMSFDDGPGSGGGIQFLERKGISVSAIRFYIRLFTHCAIQAASTRFDESTGQAVTQAAMGTFSSNIGEYDYARTYNELASIYAGRHRFTNKIEILSNPQRQFTYSNLRYPNAGVLNAKYLIETFVISNISNSNVLRGGFQVFSGTVCQALDVTLMASTHVSKSAKLNR